MDQPGYDALAELYAETFPNPYLTPLERHAVHAFADAVREQSTAGVVVDVGCGPGHVTADLVSLGLSAVGVDPSSAMLAIARDSYPNLTFLDDDATLCDAAADLPIAAILARFSLIHSPPSEVADVLALWAERTTPGTPLLVAVQSTDDPGLAEFDHVVARAWRWHPDSLSEMLRNNGFDEVWRTVSRPDADHRFPEVHLLASRR